MIKILSVILLSLVTSHYALAGAGSGNGTITQFYINSSGTLARVQFSQPTANPDGCTKDAFYLVDLSEGNGSSRFAAALLTAYTTKNTVSFWVSGCVDAAFWGGTYPKLNDIYMK